MSTLIGYKPKSGWGMAVEDAQTGAPHTHQFYLGYAASFSRDPHMYHYFNEAEITGSGARVSVIEDLRTGEAVAGARGVLRSLDCVYIGQAWTKPEYRGNGLIGRAVDILRLAYLLHPDVEAVSVTNAHLVVRMVGGKVDLSAEHAYLKVGFEKAGIDRSVIQGTSMDFHLFDTEDGDGRYSSQVMKADASSLPDAVHRIAVGDLREAA